MTNYEWIKAGGIDRMMWFDASGCECCVRCNGARGCNDTMCTNGRSAWLEAEHVEPDSWDRLEADAHEIVSDAYRKTQDGALIMIPLPDFKTTIDRAKKLAGVE